jgi:hypothetical protein
MKQRSKGFQWFVSFFSRLQGENLGDCIVLIDEPGLYLHGKAQKDLLAELERASDKVPQVIFSTHSPYMIDARRTERVRTVTRNEHVGTTVQNKIHADADLETVTPIMTAIGDAVGFGIPVGHGPNVVWEGPSDSLFIRAMAALLKQADISALNHIGCMGANNVPLLCSILHGWGAEYVAVFDNDNRGRETMDEMKKKFYVDAPCMVVSDTEGACIEDLFSRKFFADEVVQESVPAGKANSKHLKNAGDKVIRAKLFFERIERGEACEIDDETKRNFLELFEKLRLTLGMPQPMRSNGAAATATS